MKSSLAFCHRHANSSALLSPLKVPTSANTKTVEDGRTSTSKVPGGFSAVSTRYLRGDECQLCTISVTPGDRCMTRQFMGPQAMGPVSLLAWTSCPDELHNRNDSRNDKPLCWGRQQDKLFVPS